MRIVPDASQYTYSKEAKYIRHCIFGSIHLRHLLSLTFTIAINTLTANEIITFYIPLSIANISKCLRTNICVTTLILVTLTVDAPNLFPSFQYQPARHQEW